MSEIAFSSTVNGKTWENGDNGKAYEANKDRHTKVRINFDEPVYGRVLRIFPQTWNNLMSLRFEAIYLDLQ